MLLIVAGTFVVTFLIVCGIAYLLLSRRTADPSQVRRSVRRRPREFGLAEDPQPDPPDGSASITGSDDDVEALRLRDKMFHTITWLRKLTGAKPLPASALPANAVPPGDPRAPGLGVKVLLACVLLVVSVGTVLGMIAVLLQVAKWTLFPAMDAVLPLFWSIFTRPGGAGFLALLVLALGFTLAKRFRRPRRFFIGAGLIALGLVTFWPMQYGAAKIKSPFWEYNAILHFLGFFISLTLLAAGLETMRRASNTPSDDFWEI